jgi:hypothetical protein
VTDSIGKVIVPFHRGHEYVTYFDEGNVAVVEKEDAFTILDANGNVILPFTKGGVINRRERYMEKQHQNPFGFQIKRPINQHIDWVGYNGVIYSKDPK